MDYRLLLKKYMSEIRSAHGLPVSLCIYAETLSEEEYAELLAIEKETEEE